MQLQKQIRRYLVAQRQAGLSLKTLHQYEWHLSRLAVWLAERDVTDLERLSRDRLREWGAELMDRWAPATVKQAVGAVRSFLRWCHQEGLCNSNLGEALKIPRVPQRIQRTITEAEVQKLIAACDLGTVKGIRDCALVHLLIDTGLRASEVCRVRLRDANLEERFLVVVIKGGNQDYAHFGQSTLAALERWIGVRSAAPGVRTLFVAIGGGTPGRPLTVAGLRSILRHLGELAGVPHVTTHAFRRGFACIATDAGAPSRQVQVAGRWSDIRMVERYTAAIRGSRMYERWSPADHINGQNDDKPE